MTGHEPNPWWHPSDDDLGWDEPLPVIIRLAPDYSAALPLRGEGFGNIDWRYTNFPASLLDRLAPGALQAAVRLHWAGCMTVRARVFISEWTRTGLRSS